MNFFYKIYRFILVIYAKIKFKPKVYGLENLPQKGPLILVANHRSNYDFLSMGLIEKNPLHFLAKSSLFKGPLKPILKSVQVIPIDRTKKNPESYLLAKSFLEKGHCIGIFPEGTLNKTKKPTIDFKIGAVKLAYETNTPIIPIAIFGAYKKNRLRIKIGTPFYVKSSNLTLENHLLRKTIEELLRGIK